MASGNVLDRIQFRCFSHTSVVDHLYVNSVLLDHRIYRGNVICYWHDHLLVFDSPPLFSNFHEVKGQLCFAPY